MGLEIDRERFTPADHHRFQERLDRSLEVLASLLGRPGFGAGPRTLGAELELSLVDASGRPLPMNEAVLRETADERMTIELDRFNLESNLRYATLDADVFEHLESEIDSARTELAGAAAAHGGRVVAIGILPTLTEGDLSSDAMTDAIRFRALSRSLRARREGPFRVSIDGADRLGFDCDDVTVEGAATSFQLHLKVCPDEFAAVFDAARVATAPVLAAAGNSPTFLGHRLWEETRVALFKQAVDDRDVLDRLAGRPSRVGFGAGWLREGPLELFENGVSSYPVLLPVVYGEDPGKAFAEGRVPALSELRLHQGTIWHWNRPVYDPAGSGHVRIELRALPSGPTTRDMSANAAFLIGLALGLAPEISRIRGVLPFAAAEHNFYRAAQAGLDAVLRWPDPNGGRSTEVAARDLLPSLAPVARQGLARAGASGEMSDTLIDTFVDRVATGRTGAVWQRERLARLGAGRPRADTLACMLDEYMENSMEGRPVHMWSLD